MNFTESLKDFNYRRVEQDVSEIFPGFDPEKITGRYDYLQNSDPHQTVLNAVTGLWTDEYGYDWFLKQFGFHEEGYESFSGHCHQITPILGVVLKSLGFKNVAYLEARRVYPDTLEPVHPEEEQSEMREEFCKIGRIPYCCLEVEIEDELFYISGKHLVVVDGKPEALLKPSCYMDMVGVFPHQMDRTKSGIYLDVDLEDPIRWRKQKISEETPETFQTFAHMELVVK